MQEGGKQVKEEILAVGWALVGARYWLLGVGCSDFVLRSSEFDLRPSIFVNRHS